MVRADPDLLRRAGELARADVAGKVTRWRAAERSQAEQFFLIPALVLLEAGASDWLSALPVCRFGAGARAGSHRERGATTGLGARFDSCAQAHRSAAPSLVSRMT